jgi:hypothetical protein
MIVKDGSWCYFWRSRQLSLRLVGKHCCGDKFSRTGCTNLLSLQRVHCYERSSSGTNKRIEAILAWENFRTISPRWYSLRMQSATRISMIQGGEGQDWRSREVRVKKAAWDGRRSCTLSQWLVFDCCRGAYRERLSCFQCQMWIALTRLCQVVSRWAICVHRLVSARTNRIRYEVVAREGRTEPVLEQRRGDERMREVGLP